MVSYRDITKEYREAGAMNGLISLYSVVDDHTFLTKGGHLVQVLSLQGTDHECLDHPELDQISRRFEAAMRIFTGSFRVYQVMLKRDHAFLPQNEYSNPTVREAVRGRIDYLRAKADALYTVELFLVIVYEAGLGGQRTTDRIREAIRQPHLAVAEWMSREKSLRVLEGDLAQAITALTHRVSSFVVQLRDVTGLELLDTRAAFCAFGRLLTYAPYKSDTMRLHAEDCVDYQLACSALECHRNHLLLDDYYVRVLTLKEPPAQTFPNQLAALQETSLELHPDLRMEARG